MNSAGAPRPRVSVAMLVYGHEAFVAQSRWYTDAMYRSSAALVRYLCDKYNIPMDRQHIRGHNELDPARRSDPGSPLLPPSPLLRGPSPPSWSSW